MTGTGKTSRWLILLHRLGYLTTAIAIIELSNIGYVAGREWFRHREWSAKLVEQSRTH